MPGRVEPLHPLKIGCCGWSYKEWVGPFYTSTKSMFKQYSRVFDLAEMDSSFYALPNERTMATIAKGAPPGFTFTAKLPRTITHEELIRDVPQVRPLLEEFSRSMAPLGSSLRVVLVQLPPGFSFNMRSRLEDLLNTMKDMGMPAATEFRHLSWVEKEALPETERILKSAGSSFVTVDEPHLPPVTIHPDNLVYLRLHGRNPSLWYDYDYSDEELHPWLRKVIGWVKDGHEVIALFNNHPRGNAPRNAMRFMEMAGVKVKPPPGTLDAFS